MVKSLNEYFCDVRPICITRLVAESGGSNEGMPDQNGKLCNAVFKRSCTNCRANNTSMLGLKMSTMDDNPRTDFERIVSNCGVLLNTSSKGIVTNDSTSSVDKPGASVCTSTKGGANSGKTSSVTCLKCMTPNTSIIPAS